MGLTLWYVFVGISPQSPTRERADGGNNEREALSPTRDYFEKQGVSAGGPDVGRRGANGLLRIHRVRIG